MKRITKITTILLDSQSPKCLPKNSLNMSCSYIGCIYKGLCLSQHAVENKVTVPHLTGTFNISWWFIHWASGRKKQPPLLHLRKGEVSSCLLSSSHINCRWGGSDAGTKHCTGTLQEGCRRKAGPRAWRWECEVTAVFPSSVGLRLNCRRTRRL